VDQEEKTGIQTDWKKKETEHQEFTVVSADC